MKPRLGIAKAIHRLPTGSSPQCSRLSNTLSNLPAPADGFRSFRVARDDCRSQDFRTTSFSRNCPIALRYLRLRTIEGGRGTGAPRFREAYEPKKL